MIINMSSISTSQFFKVRELVPESQAYMDLLAFEQKLDATITRKKLDIQEALKRPIKVKRRLRIYISHTFIPGKEPEVCKYFHFKSSNEQWLWV